MKDILKIPEAIVQILRFGARGVLVNDIILTAAHCVSFSLTGGMVLGDYYIEEIETRRGARLKVSPLAVEPLADIAALASPDGQTFYEEANRYEDFCEETKPMQIARRRIECFKAFSVCILNADGQWVHGKATLYGDLFPSLAVEAEREIKGGASGGPIVNRQGELVAIVSNFSIPSAGETRSIGCCPRPLMALPLWTCKKFLGRGGIRPAKIWPMPSAVHHSD